MEDLKKRIMTTKDTIARNAAMWFAEIGQIPRTYRELQDTYPTGKVDAVYKRCWKKYYRDWETFTNYVKKIEPELCALALNPQPKIEEKKDPLEALRVSTTEKTNE